jgi:hypothetical protein
MSLLKESQQHLKENNESYFKHGFFALKWGFIIISLGLASILHAIFPFIFKYHAPKGILKIALMIKKKHPDLFKEFLDKLQSES